MTGACVMHIILGAFSAMGAFSVMPSAKIDCSQKANMTVLLCQHWLVMWLVSCALTSTIDDTEGVYY